MKKNDELKSVYKKLLTLYTVTTGLVLTAFLAIAFLLSVRQTNALLEETFRSSVKTLENKICGENLISDAWLEEYEYRNRLAVFAFDNGSPIFYKGIEKYPSSREYIYNQLIKITDENGIQLNAKPQSVIKSESDICYFMGENGEKYCAYVCVSLTEGGYRSFMVAQYDPEYTVGRMKTLMIYIAVDILGIAVLCFTGSEIIKKMLAPVSESKKRQSDFIAAASHELKSPLAVIRAQNSSESGDNLKRREIIEYECVRMTRLIEDMLLLASHDAGSWVIKSEKIDTEMLITEIYEMFEPLAQKKNISVNLILPEDTLPQINGDFQRLIQLFSVLADNAVSYSESGKNVEIGAALSDKNVCIYISDHGKGIPDDEKELVFDRFYRGDKSRSDKSHFGLGLCIAKELAVAMNGNITIADANGGGCTFSGIFPQTDISE